MCIIIYIIQTKKDRLVEEVFILNLKLCIFHINFSYAFLCSKAFNSNNLKSILILGTNAIGEILHK